MINQIYTSFFYFDSLAWIMMALVAFIGLCVANFSYRYMAGDANYRRFFIQLSLLVISIAAIVSANNLIVLFVAWCLSNMLLVRMMIHKTSWNAAKASGSLAAKNQFLGSLCIASSFIAIYLATGKVNIQEILLSKLSESILMLPALSLLLIGAMTQSAIWPFHRWLISSLNSPTPVSAIMHAGLVNGGGFLLARFAPLYLQDSDLLTSIFVIGIITALLGTFWKLMQSDVKRMLACSTMGQMGFMLAQCGLGLFPSAVAHLICHGMFKAYLFLASGSAAQQKRFELDYPPKPFLFICALLCGLAGSLSFAYVSGKSLTSGDSTLVLIAITFFSASQFALPILRVNALGRLPLGIIATSLIGFGYGGIMNLIIVTMGPMHLMQPQPLNSFHIFAIIAMMLTWLSILFFRGIKKEKELSAWMLQIYVMALNASQPHPSSITTHRTQYKSL